jgi:hypothetical protein
MKLKTILFLLLSFSLVMACQCKRYARHSNASDPFFGEGQGYLFNFCKNEEAIIIFPSLPKYYVNEYKLPNDSIANGYWAGLSIHNLKNDTFQVITLGKGSEFSAGKCKFRVVEVEPRKLWDSTETDFIAPHVLFQLLELPKFCPCQNKKLRKFDLERKN